MTPNIHKKYKNIKVLSDMLIPTLMLYERMELGSFERDAAPFANGTMDPILAQSMGVSDMHKSQENLKKAIEVEQKIRELHGLLITKGPTE